MSRTFALLATADAAVAAVAAELGLAVLDSDLALPGRLAGGGFVALLGFAGIAALRRGGPVPAAVLGLIGSLGIATGIGIGLGHLAVEGITPDVVTGILALAGGLALAGYGLLILARGVRGWRRGAVLPGAASVALFWVLPLVYATAGTHMARAEFSAEPPAGSVRVAVPTPDGVMLAGWYKPSRNGAAVVLLPGAGGTRASTAGHAAVLARRGYGVLALDPRGLGKSGGRGMLWGWGGERDVSAGLDFLVSRPDVDPRRLGVVGLSMGGEQALTAAPLDRRIKAVVSEGAEARVVGDLGHLRTDDLLSLVTRANCFVAFIGADMFTDAPEPASLAESVRQAAPTPILLIAADEPNERAANREMRAAAPGSVELWEPAGAGHTGALFRDAREWERRVVGFLDRALRVEADR